MKPDLLEILRCPICKSELKLDIVRTEGEDVVEGLLTCTGCHTTYPITDGIPDLLPPDERD